MPHGRAFLTAAREGRLPADGIKVSKGSVWSCLVGLGGFVFDEWVGDLLLGIFDSFYMLRGVGLCV